jgi:hypothetical protein
MNWCGRVVRRAEDTHAVRVRDDHHGAHVAERVPEIGAVGPRADGERDVTAVVRGDPRRDIKYEMKDLRRSLSHRRLLLVAQNVLTLGHASTLSPHGAR